MKHRKLNRKTRRIIETAIVIAATVALFIVCRKVAIAERGNTLIGGEIVMLAFPALHMGIRSVIKDIKRGLFR